MEREDSKEHADSGCDPLIEGGFFLQAMVKIDEKNKQSQSASGAGSAQKENITDTCKLATTSCDTTAEVISNSKISAVSAANDTSNLPGNF